MKELQQQQSSKNKEIVICTFFSLCHWHQSLWMRLFKNKELVVLREGEKLVIIYVTSVLSLLWQCLEENGSSYAHETDYKNVGRINCCEHEIIQELVTLDSKVKFALWDLGAAALTVNLSCSKKLSPHYPLVWPISKARLLSSLTSAECKSWGYRQLCVASKCIESLNHLEISCGHPCCPT